MDSDNCNAGTMMQGHRLPRRGDKPWRHSNDHWEDAQTFPGIRPGDPAFVYA